MLAIANRKGVARSGADSARPLQAASLNNSFFCSARNVMFRFPFNPATGPSLTQVLIGGKEENRLMFVRI